MTQIQLFRAEDIPADITASRDEWYTPADVVGKVRRVLGGIDLDPASCIEANRVVQAATFYSLEDDGLSKKWEGKVYMNPPYSRGNIENFTTKILHHVEQGRVSAAIVLTNNCTDTDWWQSLFGRANATCFVRRRLRFWGPHEDKNSPTQGQTLMLLCPHAYGDNDLCLGQASLIARFEREMSDLGLVIGRGVVRVRAKVQK